ncbi:MAG: TetR/AcrR family transcriptional regulator [Halorubrum sp.]
MTDKPSAADEIMDGVSRALRAHGYADLTMQDIADECSKSKSLLHYHYDTKEDLLVAFLEHIITDSAERIDSHADEPPTARLAGFVGWFVFGADAADREAFHIGLLELRTQGPFNERIREQLERSDRLLRGTVADILEDGIEDGVFREVDVQETAALIVATLDGARTRQITLSNSGSEANEPTYTRRVAEATLERVVGPLLADGVEPPTLTDGIDELTRGDDADPNRQGSDDTNTDTDTDTDSDTDSDDPEGETRLE